MALRKGRTKNILESSMDSALLAVEVYNKPRATFRVENYISLMIIAWTRLFHAYFNNSIGDRYYYKRNGRYDLVDGERKAWELGECIKQYGRLIQAVEANLKLFIGLRNKIEHRYIDKNTIDSIIFGECQALLYNYEKMLIEFFGAEYAINENLAFSLQFSTISTREQIIAQKSLLSNEVQNLYDYINKYRTELSDDVFNSQEFSIKLITIPKVSNTNRNDLAIEFVNWNSLSEEDKENYNRVAAIIKDKVVRREAVNYLRLKPSEVVEKVLEKVDIGFTMGTHTDMWKIFNIRPNKGGEDPFDTNTKYCHYDEAHEDYVYQETWVDFIVNLFTIKEMTIEQLYEFKRAGQALDIKDYE